MERAEHPAKRREQIVDLERTWVDCRLSGLDPCEVKQIVDQRQQALGTSADVLDLPFLLFAQWPVGTGKQELTECERRAQRCAELMADTRQETRFGFACTLQSLGPFVELCVQRDDAAVRFLELAVELRKLLLPRMSSSSARISSWFWS